jgi:hypothetical protein
MQLQSCNPCKNLKFSYSLYKHLSLLAECNIKPSFTQMYIMRRMEVQY